MIGQLPELKIVKTHKDNFQVGEQGTYILQVSNIGLGATSDDITVVDNLPVGLSYVSGKGKGWSCGAVDQKVTCTSSTVIPAGTSDNPAPGAPITLIVKVADDAPAKLINEAQASGGGDPSKPAEATDETVIGKAPLANSDSVKTNFNTPVILPASTNDAASNGGTLDLNSIDLDPSTPERETELVLPGMGTFRIEEGKPGYVPGTVTFIPVNGFYGTATIPYTIKDSNGLTSNEANLTVVVKPPQESIDPVANDDSGKTEMDTNVEINPLLNDAASQGEQLVPSSVKLCGIAPGDQTAPNCGQTLVFVPGEGTWEVDPVTGVVTFDPLPLFEGKASPMIYQVSDTAEKTASAQIEIIVTGGTQPLAIDDVGSTAPETPVTLPILANDDPSAGQTFNVSTLKLCGAGQVPGSTPPQCEETTVAVEDVGVWTVNGDGTVTFKPDPGFTGPASIPYEVADTSNKPANALITIMVNPDSLEAVDDTADTPYDTPVTLDPVVNDREVAKDGQILNPSTIRLCDITSNPQQMPPDCDKSSLTVPGQGTWTVKTDGKVEFDPLPSFSGGTTTKVPYQIYDSLGNVGVADLWVTVGQGTRPVANNDQFGTVQGIPITESVTGNDIAPPGSKYFLVSQDPVPQGGSFNLNTDGSFTFNPGPDFTGTYVFVYQVCLPGVSPPSAAYCDDATVTIGVTQAEAQDDNTVGPSGGTGVVNPLKVVLGPDGRPLKPEEALVIPPETLPAGFSYDPATGNVNVAPGTRPGKYQMEFVVCVKTASGQQLATTAAVIAGPLQPGQCALVTLDVVVTGAPIPKPIPTLGEWGRLMLMLMLLGIVWQRRGVLLRQQ